MPKKKVELVHDWRHARKWLSVRLSIAGTGGMGLWLMLPQLKDYVPADWLAIAAMGLFILICLSRLINQGTNERNKKDDGTT